MGEGGGFLDTVPVGWAILATAVFLALNGFFVAAEFALVKVRTIRIAALAQKGRRQAIRVERILGRLDTYLSACQLGITLSSLILGWLAEPAVARLLLLGADSIGLPVHDSPALHLAALLIALSVVTVLHMVLGEQAPKIWAIQRAETMSLAVALPLRAFAVVFQPVIWLINALSNALLRLGGLSGDIAHDGIQDLDELRAILKTASRSGHISRGQRTIGENVLKLMELQVRHVMVPRRDVVALDASRPAAENLDAIRAGGHSRFPVCDGDLDHPLGLVHGKDILGAFIDGSREPDIRSLMRPLPALPDTQPLSRMILDCQKGQHHCALVVDEHGTSLGMVFLEDGLEEIVGPIYDEFDERESPWERVSPETIEVSGALPFPDAAELLDLDPATGSDTVAGHVTAHLGRLPTAGEVVELPPYRVTVLSISGRRVRRLKFETLAALGDAQHGDAESTPAG